MMILFSRLILMIFLSASAIAYATVLAIPEPIAVYLTWQRDPTTTMTVQWVFPIQQADDRLDFHAAGDSYWQHMHADAIAIPGDERNILYRAELTGLIPNKDYFFRLGSAEKLYNFRTMPTNSTVPIRFVVGGDIYHDGIEPVRETNLKAAQQSPWFALVGGDLAYGGDKYSILPETWRTWVDKLLSKVEKVSDKKQRWLDWLSLWKQTMVTPEGRLIPLVPALGNHDVNGGFGRSAAEAQLFHTYFPFPGKQGYQVLDFGTYMSIIVLDSGHTNPIGGQQSRWLYDVMRARGPITHKFALYHVPAYPSVRKYNGKVSSEVRHFWVPIFEMHGLTAAFEHHDHAYKRTHPLMGGKINPKGVLFFGDGAWGVEEPRIPDPPQSRWYLAQTAAKRHFIMVTIRGQEKHFEAVDSKGIIFDELLTGN